MAAPLVIRTQEDWDDVQRAFRDDEITEAQYIRRMSKAAHGGTCCRNLLPSRMELAMRQAKVSYEREQKRRRKSGSRKTTTHKRFTMPLLIHGRCYKTFAAAKNAVMKWKKLRGKTGDKRARAYTATVMRRQEGTENVRLACGTGRGRKGNVWAPKKVSRPRRSAKKVNHRNLVDVQKLQAAITASEKKIHGRKGKYLAMKACAKWGRGKGGRKVCRKWRPLRAGESRYVNRTPGKRERAYMAKHHGRRWDKKAKRWAKR